MQTVGDTSVTISTVAAGMHDVSDPTVDDGQVDAAVSDSISDDDDDKRLPAETETDGNPAAVAVPNVSDLPEEPAVDNNRTHAAASDSTADDNNGKRLPAETDGDAAAVAAHNVSDPEAVSDVDSDCVDGAVSDSEADDSTVGDERPEDDVMVHTDDEATGKCAAG